MALNEGMTVNNELERVRKKTVVAYLKVSFPNHYIAKRDCIESADWQPPLLRLFYFIVLMPYRKRIILLSAGEAEHTVAMRHNPTA